MGTAKGGEKKQGETAVSRFTLLIGMGDKVSNSRN